MVEVIVAVVSATGLVVVAVVGGFFTAANHRQTSTDQRVNDLWERVDRLELKLEMEREYSVVLQQHIMDGKPPPPPPRPNCVNGGAK